MINRLFLIFISTTFIIHTAEKSSSKPLVMQFSNDLEITFEHPFLYRFNQLRTLASENTEAALKVHFDQKMTPEMGITLQALITKPSADIATFNIHGNYSDELFDAARMLGLRTKNYLPAQSALAQFNQAFLDATIRENAVQRWCTEARTKLIDTKRLPTGCDNSPLNKLTTFMQLAIHYNKAEHAHMIYEIAYDTGLASTLYTHMYGRLSRIIAARPQSKKHNEIGSKEYLSLIKNKLFESGAWYCYAALHGTFKSEDYDTLLYGEDTLQFPTRHYHVALHDTIQECRDEYDHNGKPLMPCEITTCYHKNSNSFGLRFKQMQYMLNGPKQTIFFTYFDAVLLQKIIATKKPSCLYYDLSGENREVSIAPQALNLLASFPSAIHINLGTLSPDNAAALEQNLEKHMHTKKINMQEYTRDEYKKFHRNTPKHLVHQAFHLQKPITNITFLSTHKEPGAELTYATIDDTISCACE